MDYVALEDFKYFFKFKDFFDELTSLIWDMEAFAKFKGLFWWGKDFRKTH